MEKFSSGCTLDCFDCCKFNVYVDNGKVQKVEGDKEHPYTKGFICKKGRAHLTRHNHPDRQYSPMVKVNGKWKNISFEEALDKMAEKLAWAKEKAGNQSVLYYEQYGSGSILKSIGDTFFDFFGGCAKQTGGPCWSAGIEAQKRNFGDVKSHALEDMLNSKTILIWGKNPANTTIHTMQMIKQAQKQGSLVIVIVIDPIKTETARQADYYIPVKPGGDSALALAMAKRILELEKHDKDYIKAYVNGFEAFQSYLESWKMEQLCKKAGVSLEVVDFLVESYTQKYSTILLGYGLQKYYHGGNTIQLIDALAAITGQIGENGGGVNYANRVFPDVLNHDPYGGAENAKNDYYQTSHIASYIKEKNIQVAVIVKSNLVAQLPGGEQLEQAIKDIPFTVCFDPFITDTAQCCDLFIPATSVFESEDLLYSSMTNPYLTYIQQAVKPKHPCMDEYVFFQELAKRLAIANYPMVSKQDYLTKVIAPLKEYEKNISLEYLKDHYVTIHKKVPWADKVFKTSSGKFELLFEDEPEEDNKEKENGAFRLLTTHGKDTLFTQHYMDKEGIAKVYMNQKMASANGFLDKEQLEMFSQHSDKGKILVELRVDDSVCDKVVRMDVGWWKKHGNPNYILQSGITDMGGQVTYHENVVYFQKLSS